MRVRHPIDLGLVIRERRRKLHLDQRSLADQTGVSRQWIIAVEKGNAGAEFGLVLKALNALGLQLSLDAEQGGRQVLRPGPDIDAVIERARRRTVDLVEPDGTRGTRARGKK